jgi:hypothetical protein
MAEAGATESLLGRLVFEFHAAMNSPRLICSKVRFPLDAPL